MPVGDLLAGMYERHQGGRLCQPFQVQQETVPVLCCSAPAYADKNWSYVATIVAGPMGQEGFNEPVIVRLSQCRHRGAAHLQDAHRQRKPHLPGPFRRLTSHLEPGPAPSAGPYLPLGLVSGRIMGVDSDLTEMHVVTLMASFGQKPDFKDGTGSSWPSDWTRGTPGLR